MPAQKTAESCSSCRNTFAPVIGIILIALLSAFLSQYFAPPKAINSYITGGGSGNGISDEGISVRATSTIYIEPDLAIVTFGITTYDNKIDAAQRKNSEKMKEVIEAFKTLGIEEMNMQTSNYNVYTSYDYSDDTWPFKEKDVPEVEYYEVSHMLTVRIENLENVEELLNVAVEKGVTNISSIEFTLKDFAEAREKAYLKAVETAKARADYIAKGLGVNLGPVLSLTASHDDYDYSWYGSSMANQSVQFQDFSGSGGGSISTGEIEVKVNVNARYGIEYSK